VAGRREKRGAAPARRRARAPRRERPTREQQAEDVKLQLSVERLDEELARVALFDPREILDPKTGAMLPLHEWPERARRALASYEEEALFEEVPAGGVGPRGGVVKARVQVGVVRKVKWLNKIDALRLGMQRLGALVEKHEHLVAAVPMDDITDEEMEALAHLMHGVRGKKAPDAK
jgi:hypothetical protein